MTRDAIAFAILVGWPLLALLTWVAGWPLVITALMLGQSIGYLIIYAVHPGGLRLDLRRWRR